MSDYDPITDAVESLAHLSARRVGNSIEVPRDGGAMRLWPSRGGWTALAPGCVPCVMPGEALVEFVAGWLSNPLPANPPGEAVPSGASARRSHHRAQPQGRDSGALNPDQQEPRR